VRYKYCPKCDILRPRTFMMDDRCEGCRDGAVTIAVKRSAYGIAMYIVSLVAAVMVLLYVANRDFNADFARFMSGINTDLFIITLFVLLAIAFVLSFLDLGRTNAEARRIVDEKKGRW
jgi:hypothetical protein